MDIKSFNVFFILMCHKPPHQRIYFSSFFFYIKGAIEWNNCINLGIVK